ELVLYKNSPELMPPADSPVTPTYSSAMNEPTTTADIITIPIPSEEKTQLTANWVEKNFDSYKKLSLKDFIFSSSISSMSTEFKLYDRRHFSRIFSSL
ncbi:9575_t:CDS:2, partial [Dentiscutata erythropus]